MVVNNAYDCTVGSSTKSEGTNPLGVMVVRTLG